MRRFAAGDPLPLPAAAVGCGVLGALLCRIWVGGGAGGVRLLQDCADPLWGDAGGLGPKDFALLSGVPDRGSAPDLHRRWLVQ